MKEKKKPYLTFMQKKYIGVTADKKYPITSLINSDTIKQELPKTFFQSLTCLNVSFSTFFSNIQSFTLSYDTSEDIVKIYACKWIPEHTHLKSYFFLNIYLRTTNQHASAITSGCIVDN